MGDPSSKFRGSIATAIVPATAAAAEAAAAGLETSDSVGGGSRSTDMPAAIEITNRGLLGGSTIGAGDSEDVDGGRSGGGGVGGGGSGDSGADQEEVAERGAIADVFRTVDLDGSGHVSHQEFLEAVSISLVEAQACHVRCHVPPLRGGASDFSR